MRVKITTPEDKKTETEAEDDDVNNWKDFDIFVTVLRRKYIPPLMECYQDIIVKSSKLHNYR